MAKAICDMRDYRRRMCELIKIPNVSQAWEVINAMQVGQVVTSLLRHQLCISGTSQVLRERLLKAEMRLALPEEVDVPFVERYDLGQSDKIFLLEAYPEPESSPFPNVTRKRGGRISSEDDEESSSGESGASDCKVAELVPGEGGKRQQIGTTYSRRSPTNDALTPRFIPPPPVMSTASMTTTSPTTTSAHMMVTTSTIMSAPHTIQSATMAPNVQSMRDAVARLSLTPEIERLAGCTERLESRYRGGGDGIGNRAIARQPSEMAIRFPTDRSRGSFRPTDRGKWPRFRTRPTRMSE